MLAVVLGNPSTPAPVVRPSINDVILAVETKYAEWAEPQLIEQIAARVTGPDPATIAATIEQVLAKAMASAEVIDLTPPSESGDMLRPSDGRPVEMTPSAVRYTSVRHLQRELAVVDWATSTDHRGHRAVPAVPRNSSTATRNRRGNRRGHVAQTRPRTHQGRWLAGHQVGPPRAFCGDHRRNRDRPELLNQQASSYEDDLRVAIADGLRAMSGFDDLVADEVAWTDHVTVEVVVQRLASHSAHRLLEPDQSAAINEALHHELGAPTDVIDLSYTTHIFTAARR